MRKLFTLPNLYVLLWALYYTQGFFIPRGSVFSRGILVIFLLISVYFLLVMVAKYKQTLYFKSMGALLLMFTIYGIISILKGGGIGYLQMIYLSLLPIYSFYVFTQKGLINERWIRIVFFIMVGVTVVEYLLYFNFINESGQDTENATINVGYEVVALLPLIYFWKHKPIVQYLLLALVLAVVITTVKRGAILVAALCMFYFIYNTMKISSRKTRWYVWLVVLIFVVVGVRWVSNFYINSEYAQTRMQATLEGYSSGRDSIFKKAWEVFLNSNTFGILFGHGAFATIDIMGIAAHNDWLEILVNQGLLGVTLYFFYWRGFYVSFRRDKNPETKPIIGTVLIIYFVAALFSMSYSAMTLPATLALGYCLAKQDNNQYVVNKR